MKTYLLILLASLGLVACSSSDKTIVVKNTLDVNRTSELVEIPVKHTAGEFFLVTDEAGQPIASQLTYDGKLLFQPNLKANESKSFKLSVVDKEDSYTARVYGRLFGERYDDFAWENDKVGFRFYGKALEAVQAPTNGIDLWLKRTERMVLEDWYKGDISKTASYHVDHGEGCDPYGVGPTLGAGAISPFVNGELLRNTNYEAFEVLDNGPLRITFKVTYPAIQIGEITYKDEKIVSLDAGSHYTRIQQDYGTDELEASAGIVMRGDKGQVFYDDNGSYMIYEEPEMEKDGKVYVGLVTTDVFDKQFVYDYTIDANSFKHTLALKKIKGVPFVYYTGFGWSKSKHSDVQSFINYTTDFVASLKTPFEVVVN